jgi:hypothetical protein
MVLGFDYLLHPPSCICCITYRFGTSLIIFKDTVRYLIWYGQIWLKEYLLYATPNLRLVFS